MRVRGVDAIYSTELILLAILKHPATDGYDGREYMNVSQAPIY